jgi:hypothetical protein
MKTTGVKDCQISSFCAAQLDPLFGETSEWGAPIQFPSSRLVPSQISEITSPSPLQLLHTKSQEKHFLKFLHLLRNQILST